MKATKERTGGRNRRAKGQRHSVGERLLAGMRELDEWLAGSDPLEACFTVRTISDIPQPSEYDGQRIAALRQRLGASQPVFARLIGVSAPLVRAWERNGRHPSAIARRLLDEIERDPTRWKMVLRKGHVREPAA